MAARVGLRFTQRPPLVTVSALSQSHAQSLAPLRLNGNYVPKKTREAERRLLRFPSCGRPAVRRMNPQVASAMLSSKNCPPHRDVLRGFILPYTYRFVYPSDALDSAP
jgi:hypothetical protein